MTHPSNAYILAAVICAVALPAAAQRSDVVPPQRRAATVEKAARIVQSREAAAVASDIKNPFSPPGFDRPDPAEQPPAAPAGPARPAGPRSDRELLAEVAPRITPSGTAILGGEPILLFGQKKVKVGDQLSITFDGASYVLVIAAIERTSFTLRLNREEVTRPIKPASTP
ncbi:MAG TPA: hypothetical protein VGD81_14920 [Opitutaceae bacterium]